MTRSFSVKGTRYMSGLNSDLEQYAGDLNGPLAWKSVTIPTRSYLLLLNTRLFMR